MKPELNARSKQQGGPFFLHASVCACVWCLSVAHHIHPLIALIADLLSTPHSACSEKQTLWAHEKKTHTHPRSLGIHSSQLRSGCSLIICLPVIRLSSSPRPHPLFLSWALLGQKVCPARLRLCLLCGGGRWGSLIHNQPSSMRVTIPRPSSSRRGRGVGGCGCSVSVVLSSRNVTALCCFGLTSSRRWFHCGDIAWQRRQKVTRNTVAGRKVRTDRPSWYLRRFPALLPDRLSPKIIQKTV